MPTSHLFPLVAEKNLLGKRHQFLQVRYPSCHQNNSVKELNGTKSTGVNLLFIHLRALLSAAMLYCMYGNSRLCCTQWLFPLHCTLITYTSPVVEQVGTHVQHESTHADEHWRGLQTQWYASHAQKPTLTKLFELLRIAMPVHQCCAKLEKYVQPLHMSHMHTTTSATADYTCSVLGYYSADFI